MNYIEGHPDCGRSTSLSFRRPLFLIIHLSVGIYCLVPDPFDRYRCTKMPQVTDSIIKLHYVNNALHIVHGMNDNLISHAA
jgi:hypothetical protein